MESNDWEEEVFETNRNPKEGEPVQYIAMHMLRWEKIRRVYEVPKALEEGAFWLRKKEE